MPVRACQSQRDRRPDSTTANPPAVHGRHLGVRRRHCHLLMLGKCSNPTVILKNRKLRGASYCQGRRCTNHERVCKCVFLNNEDVIQDGGRVALRDIGRRA
ncbi:hypothetical protein NDU88_003487 [Pleurodeles waltl]|uniref:Uncharacterized protein n=1 Tax=Pleurodeles waltl TaxID=8319 RepID=A0AAV7MUE1_PLEWA|nr:hypothetical protein NDU88_003487 [Pleurodeles waltl]